MNIDTQTKQYMEEGLENQKHKSNMARLEYERTQDADILINYIRNSHFALKEPWVGNALNRLRIDGRLDVFDRAFHPWVGENEDKQTPIIKALETCIMVDELVRQKKITKTAAFKTLASNAQGDGWESIRKTYYAYWKHAPEIYYEKTEDAVIIIAYPAVFEENGVKWPCQWNLVIPFDGGDITINVKAYSTQRRMQLLNNLSDKILKQVTVEGNTPI